MRYNIVAGVATSAFTVLASATSNVGSIPEGCTHKEGWGNAVVINQISEPVYFVLDNQPSTATIAPSAQTAIPIYEKDADQGGLSIKLFKDKNTDLWAVPAITQFEITATDMQYFDVSNVNSDIGSGLNGNGEQCDKQPPFTEDGMKITTPDGKDVTCAPGQNPCKTAYSKNDDNFATSATPLGNDITLTLGTGSKKASGGLSKIVSGLTGGNNKKVTANPPPQQPAKPKPQPKKIDDVVQKPKAEVKKQESNDDDDVVWVTATATNTAAPTVQTVYVDQDGKPYDHKVKRQDHIHQHLHNKVHKRRHGA